MKMVQFESVTFHHPSKRVLDEVSLHVPRGKVTVILGPSGTGKTTVLKLMTGSFRPQRGVVKYEGRDLAEFEGSELLKLRQQIGFLFQSSALFTNYSVFDNVAFPLRELTSLSEALIRTVVLMNLEAVGLRGARDLFPSELSGGMSRRVALARALVLDPKLMLYDEPFTGQDPISMGVLLKLIKSLNEQLGMTSVVVSHDIQEALSIADWVYVLADQKILASGTPDDFNESDIPQLKQFIKGLPDGPVPFHYPSQTMEEDLLC